MPLLTLDRISLAYGHLPGSRDKLFLRQLAAWVLRRIS